jgi:hypothetical protein
VIPTANPLPSPGSGFLIFAPQRAPEKENRRMPPGERRENTFPFVNFHIPQEASPLSPDQSANARIKSSGRPNRRTRFKTHEARGTQVCVLFCENK